MSIRIVSIALTLIIIVSCKKGGGQNTPPNANADPNNLGFENDAATQTPSVWQTSGNADADFTEVGGYPSGGGFALTHKKNVDYQVYTFQKITGLANGTYTLTARARDVSGPQGRPFDPRVPGV